MHTLFERKHSLHANCVTQIHTMVHTNGKSIHSWVIDGMAIRFYSWLAGLACIQRMCITFFVRNVQWSQTCSVVSSAIDTTWAPVINLPLSFDFWKSKNQLLRTISSSLSGDQAAEANHKAMSVRLALSVVLIQLALLSQLSGDYYKNRYYAGFVGAYTFMLCIQTKVSDLQGVGNCHVVPPAVCRHAYIFLIVFRSWIHKKRKHDNSFFFKTQPRPHIH